MKKRRVKHTSSIPAGLGLSVLVSLSITLLAAALMAFLTAGEYMQESAQSAGAAVGVLASSAAGALTAVRRIQQKQLWMCLAAAALYYLCLLAMTAMFFGGEYANMAVTALSVFGGCAIVILLQMRGNKGRRKGTVKYRPR